MSIDRILASGQEVLMQRPLPLAVDRLGEMTRRRVANGFDGTKMREWSDRQLQLLDRVRTAPDAAAEIKALKEQLRAKYRELFGVDQLTVEEQPVTAGDLAYGSLDMTDQFAVEHLRRKWAGMDTSVMHRDMHIDGIGYGPLNGVTCQVALEPLRLPEALEDKVDRLRAATFAFYDVVGELYGDDRELTELLDYKRPEVIPNIVKGRVDIVRPDIVIVREADGQLGLRVTEWESAPGGHGILSSLEAGNRQNEIVRAFEEYLDGRPYRVALTTDWVDYAFEQAAFCKLLAARGIDAKVVLDKPLDEVARRAKAEFAKGKRIPGVEWNDDFMDRLAKGNIADVVEGSDEFEGAGLQDATVFRMAYLSNLSPRAMAVMASCPQMMNGMRFDLESKGLMAAIRVKAVRDRLEQIDAALLASLDQCVAPTMVLTPGKAADIRARRKELVMKYAAWSFDGKDWGARSVVVGSLIAQKGWEAAVAENLDKPHPVVVQDLAQTVRVPMAYRDLDGTTKIASKAGTRLNPFFIRGSSVTPNLLTLREGSVKIHGATDAIVSLVEYRDDEPPTVS